MVMDQDWWYVRATGNAEDLKLKPLGGVLGAPRTFSPLCLSSESVQQEIK